MIAVDTNILVHAHREESPKHVAAHARVVALAESSSRWAISVLCIGEFVRVITHPRLFDPPYSAHEACEALDILEAAGFERTKAEAIASAIGHSHERAATKSDLEPLGTKAELALCATKADLEPLATKTELAQCATKSDLKPLATRAELSELEARLTNRFYGVAVGLAGVVIAGVKLL